MSDAKGIIGCIQRAYRVSGEEHIALHEAAENGITALEAERDELRAYAVQQRDMLKRAASYLRAAVREVEQGVLPWVPGMRSLAEQIGSLIAENPESPNPPGVSRDGTSIGGEGAGERVEGPPICHETGTQAAEPCCGEYETCQRACTPRGRWLASRHQSCTKPARTQEEWMLHILRNPYSHSEDAVRQARLWAADQIEAASRHQVNRYTVEEIAAVLTVHWLTEIQCQHDAKTDRSFCWCGSFICEPQPSVGGAVRRWVEHVMAQLPLHREASQSVAGKNS